MENMAIADQIIQRQDKDGMLRRALERIIQLYTDKSHFVYELLQNAEDAGATRIEFYQYENRLEVLHNGHPFTRENLQGLCDIGKSDKINDLNKIGEFGVGFKSVFGICETVKVYSHPRDDNNDNSYQRFAVEIIDFTRPVDIEDVEFSDDFTTKFVFPYSVGYSFSGFETIKNLNAGISKRLMNLGINTLLFMKNLQSIYYSIETAAITTAGTYELEKVIINDHCSLITALGSSGKSKENPVYYLVFSRNVSGVQSDRTIDIAISMRKAEGGGYIYQPTNHPFISVFFPTETESKLKFIVQGPYRTTPNRSSVPADDKDNLSLANQTAELLRDSFLELRDNKMLNFSLLNLLPLEEKAFDNAPLFKCIYEKSVEMLKSDGILHCKDGTFTTADHVKLARGNEFAEVLNESLLTELINDGKDYHWLPLFLTETSKAYKVMYDFLVNVLDVDVIRPEILKPYFDKNKLFLQRRDDAWLIKLYNIFSAVGAAFSKSKQRGGQTLLTAEFVKTSKGTFVAPYRKAGGDTGKDEYIFRGYENSSYIPNVFLPVNNPEGMDDINFVDPNLFNNCKHFFAEVLGLQQPNKYEVFVRDYIKRGQNGCQSTQEEHISDINNILRYRTNPDYSEEISALTEKYLRLRCRHGESVISLNPLKHDIFLPVTKDGLNIELYFKNVKDCHYVDTDYYKNNNVSIDQLISLGVKGTIELNSDITNGEYYINKPGKQPNWHTDGPFRWKLTLMHLNDVLTYICTHPKSPDSMAKSSLIFRYLLLNEYRLCGDIIIGGRTENVTDALSTIVTVLKKKPSPRSPEYLRYTSRVIWDGKWLYTSSGDLVSQRDISKKELNTSLYGDINQKSRIYDWLEFKKSREDRFEEIDKEYSRLSRETKNRYFELELLKRYGLTLSEFVESYEAGAKNTNGRAYTLDEQSYDEFPVSNIRNWDSLRKHAAEILCFASPVRYEYVRRHIRVSRPSKDAQAYIKSMYKMNGSSRYACQMCHDAVVNVESCQIANKPKEELDPMNICLCPNCASIYRNARINKSEIDTFINTIINLSDSTITSNDYVEIPFHGEKIWFTQTHIAEIRELLVLKKQTDSINASSDNKAAPSNDEQNDKSHHNNTTSSSNVNGRDDTGYIGKLVYHVTRKAYAKVVDFDGKFMTIKYERGQRMKGTQMISFKVCMEKGIIKFVD